MEKEVSQRADPEDTKKTWPGSYARPAKSEFNQETTHPQESFTMVPMSPIFPCLEWQGFFVSLPHHGELVVWKTPTH